MIYIYILPMFEVVSICVQGQPRLEIEIQDHHRTRFDATNPMVVSNLSNEPPLKITFFEVSLIVSIFVKFQQLDIRSSVLETEHTPRLVLMSSIDCPLK